MGILDSLERFADNVGRAIVGKQNLSGPMMTPPGVVQAFTDNGMTGETPLGPGAPIPPAFGYNLEPRQYDYRTGQNINNRPRNTERISFSTLKALIDSYDIAQLCILHRIASIRALSFKITPLDGFVGDQVEAAIRYAKSILEFPDGELPFDSWLSKFLWDVLAYDAGCLYRIRDSFGNVIGLDVVDGTTIAPMIDQYGRRPTPPAVAYVQFVQGLGTVDMDASQLIYLPYTPISHSLYGRAPIETILLNANTDMRFQAFFLQRFTEGNIPQMFATAPETWTPEQILAFQDTWDAFLKGDAAAKSQIKWVPGGTKFQDTNEANSQFNKDMADMLLRKTAAAYHVTPADLGFTDSVNRSSGETQADVAERVADRPLTGYVGGILTRFLQQDLHLPLQFEFILDSDDDDGLATAQADVEYIKFGVISVSEIREKRFGLTDPSDEVVPRFVFTNAAGPVPLSTLMAAATSTDPETALPVPGSYVSADQTTVLPVGESVGGKGSGPAGIPEATPADGAFKSELATFNRYVKKVAKSGRAWRDFTFNAVPSKLGRELNRAGRTSLAKDGETIAAGLLVYALDTGRVLMLQRALDDADPASGTWEFPGGHIEPGERPIDAAFREWQEEVGCVAEGFDVIGSWESGVYQGFIATVESEDLVPCRIGSTDVLNPDDPDGDNVETVAWWDPSTLGGNPAIRQELALALPTVFAALTDAVNQEPADVVPTYKSDAAKSDPCLCCGGSGEHITGRECYGCDASGVAAFFTGSVPCDGVEEAVPPFPVTKGWRDGAPKTPQHEFDLRITDHYAPIIAKSIQDWLANMPIEEIAGKLAATLPIQKAFLLPDPETGKDQSPLVGDLKQNAVTFLEKYVLPDFGGTLLEVGRDGWIAGERAAYKQLQKINVSVSHLSAAATDVNWDTWEPGNPPAADKIGGGGLQGLLSKADITVKGVSDTAIDQISNMLAQGLLNGDSIDSMAKSIRDTVGDPARAERIAHTETTRAVTASTFQTYENSGVTQWNFILSDSACPECEDAANGSPYSGFDTEDAPPLHPYCRCASSPVADTVNPDAIRTMDDGEVSPVVSDSGPGAATISAFNTDDSGDDDNSDDNSDEEDSDASDDSDN